MKREKTNWLVGSKMKNKMDLEVSLELGRVLEVKEMDLEVRLRLGKV